MQLVEFEHRQGHKIWVNPTDVVFVLANSNDGANTVITFSTREDDAITVKGKLADVAQKLNDGLKD